MRETSDLVDARPASLDEAVLTAQLANNAADELRDDRGGRWLLAHDLPRIDAQQKHEAAISADDQSVIVGLIDGVVVGYALSYLSAAENETLCMIEELVVHPDARAIGVGSHVLAQVREWAVEQGCAAIESQVLPGNRAAKNFFERVGMKTRKMRVSADL